MAERAEQRFSYQEYLDRERESLEKHEWFDGRIFAMAGGTPNHSILGTNITVLVGLALRGKPCRPQNGDLRIRIPETGLATYPDLSVICGGIEPHPEDPHAAVNPTALVEVLSKSTEAYDRGEKFHEHYRTLASLRHYVLVSQAAVVVEHWARNDDGSWTVRHLREGDELQLLGVRIPVDEIYQDARLLPEEAPDRPRA